MCQSIISLFGFLSSLSLPRVRSGRSAVPLYSSSVCLPGYSSIRRIKSELRKFEASRHPGISTLPRSEPNPCAISSFCSLITLFYPTIASNLSTFLCAVRDWTYRTQSKSFLPRARAPDSSSVDRRNRALSESTRSSRETVVLGIAISSSRDH